MGVYMNELSVISQPMFEIFIASSQKRVKFNISKKILSIICDLAYTGTCDFQAEDVLEVLAVAQEFKILYLGYLGGEMLLQELKIFNGLQFYRYSSQFLCEHYTTAIKKFIVRNLSDLLLLECFQVNSKKI